MYCPNCGKEIEDWSKFCKYCGAKIGESEIQVKEERIQQALENLPSYDVPKMIPRDVLKEGEKIIFEVRPHKLYTLLGPWIFAATLILIGVLFLIGIGISSIDKILVGIGIVIEVSALLVIIFTYLKWRYTVYALTTGRVIKLSGVIGKDFYESPLEKVQDIRLKIGIIQRMFGCGNIMISTAGTAGIECVWKNIGNPREVQKTLRALLGR